MIDKRAEEKVDEQERRAEIERQDALLAAKLLKTNDRGPIMRARKNKVKKPKSTDRAAPNNGFNREMVLSTELQDVIGQERASRPQVVKLIWAYIKENNLQNPNDKRQIHCDEKLTKLFKKSEYDT